MSQSYSDDNGLDKTKRYRGLLRARYIDREGNMAVLEEVAYVSAYNTYDAEIQLKVYPKREASQENWHVSQIECIED